MDGLCSRSSPQKDSGLALDLGLEDTSLTPPIARYRLQAPNPLSLASSPPADRSWPIDIDIETEFSKYFRVDMEQRDSPPISQPTSTNFTPSPPHQNEIFTPTTQQDMEGIQMVMAGLEAANLSMQSAVSEAPSDRPFTFQDGEMSNLPGLSLSPELPPHAHPSTISWEGDGSAPSQTLFSQQPTSHPGSATTSPPPTLFQFPSPIKTDEVVSGPNPTSVHEAGTGGQINHMNDFHSTLTSPVNMTFNQQLIQPHPSVASTSPAINNINVALANGQSSDEHALPSGYVTPQSSGPALLDFSPNVTSPVNLQASSTAPSGVGEDRNFVILDLARRLQQSALILTQAVQEGKQAEVETQLAHVDQLAALMIPLRKVAPLTGARRETLSSPPTTSSILPSSNPMNQQHSPLSANGHVGEHPPQLQSQFSRPPSPKPNMMGLLLDNEASRKRCASAVTDGDRIIKSLKTEAKEAQSQQTQSLTTGTSNPNLIGMMPPPLQLGFGEMPPSSLGSLSPSFVTPLSPSTNDPFFGQPPLTPASSIPSGNPMSHTMFGAVTSNPPSAPGTRPPSPMRHIQIPQAPPIHPVPSMIHQSPSMPSMPTLANGQFTMQHGTVSWSDLTAAAAAPAQPSMPYPAFTNVTAPQQQQMPSYPPSGNTTPARTRQSRSSSHSRVDMNAVAASQVVMSADRARDGVIPSGYITPATTKIEEHEMDSFLNSAASYSTSFSLSAPHSPRSTSSDDSFEIPGGPSPPTQVLPSNAPAGVVATSIFNSHHPSSSVDSTISMDEFAELNHIPNPNHPGNEIPPEFKHDVERIFVEFLNKICSNLEATDAKGELIHQTLMAKKMQRLDESPDFRPFKFRIQAFTNAFLEELARQGYPEDRLPMKKVRGYLWIQPFISRYNEDGKKAKSKGNHIWNIDAKKHPDGGWIFRRFHRKIAGLPPGVAYQGLQWSYKPHIWDPQQSRKNENVHYSSPWLPSWLHWERDTLKGTPPEDADSTDITVEARFNENGVPELLTTTFHLTVAPINAGDVNSMNALGMQARPPVTGDNGLSRRVNSDSMVPSFATLPQRPPLPRQTTRVNAPSAAPSSRVVEVLNDATNRVIQNQNVASLSFADPQLQASLARQQQVLNVATAAIEGTNSSFEPQNIQTNAIANVGTQFVASTVDVLMQERRTMTNFSPVEANLTVREVSEVTQKAIARAVDSLPPNSTEVEVLMAAKAFVQTGNPGTLQETQTVNSHFVAHPNMQDASNYAHGTVLPSPP